MIQLQGGPKQCLIPSSFCRVYFIIFECYPLGKLPLTAITDDKLRKRHLNSYLSRQGTVCTVHHNCRKRVITSCDVLRKAAGGSKRNQKVVARSIFQAVTICGAGKLRARLLGYWRWKCSKGFFKDPPMGFSCLFVHLKLLSSLRLCLTFAAWPFALFRIVRSTRPPFAAQSEIVLTASSID